MRYIILILLASVAIVACGNSDAPDCTSSAVSRALHDYLLDAADYGTPSDSKLEAFLAGSQLTADGFRTTSQDEGLHSSRCMATVHFKKDSAEVTETLAFSDHLPGDQRHVIEADLSDLHQKLDVLLH